jgi:hypothetical protein
MFVSNKVALAVLQGILIHAGANNSHDAWLQ